MFFVLLCLYTFYIGVRSKRNGVEQVGFKEFKLALCWFGIPINHVNVQSVSVDCRFTGGTTADIIHIFLWLSNSQILTKSVPSFQRIICNSLQLHSIVMPIVTTISFDIHSKQFPLYHWLEYRFMVEIFFLLTEKTIVLISYWIVGGISCILEWFHC